MRPIVGIPCMQQEPRDELGRDGSVVPQSYLRAVEAAGAAPLLIPLTDQVATLEALYSAIDGLLLVGGVDVDPAHYGEAPHPSLGQIDAPRDWVELTLIPWAMRDALPVLGICRGIQVLNVACGGSLWQDIAAQVPAAGEHRFYPDYPFSYPAHHVSLERGCRLATILRSTEVMVNSLHHQAVKAVGQGLWAAGHSPDGLIEAVEGVGPGWVVAVQWHPEWLLEAELRMAHLFQAFVAACAGQARL